MPPGPSPVNTLVVDRRTITQCGMATMRVVPTFDPFKNGHLRLRLTFEATTTEQLSLERGEKALRHRVVVRITDRSHRGHDTGLSASLAERIARVLASTIRMMDHRLRPPLRDRHVQCRQNQLRTQMRLHRPANHASRIHIEHHRQIQKTRPGRDETDIGDPQSIRPVGIELPIDQIDRAPAPGSLSVVTT